ncbi:E3 ubiquitin-protein ligase protein [Acrasis kona]|uniref:E3 ubiquitin-protein ligase protein n=1 Tax=Acrasis kona TaxID=1008807 RepID=A0AAW2ZKG6_9EUKA
MEQNNESRTPQQGLQRLNELLSTLTRSLGETVIHSSSLNRRGLLQQIVSSIQNQQRANDDDSSDDDEVPVTRTINITELLRNRNFFFDDEEDDDDDENDDDSSELIHPLIDDEDYFDPEECEYIRTHIVKVGFGATGIDVYKRSLQAGIFGHNALRVSRTRRLLSFQIYTQLDSAQDDFLMKILRQYVKSKEDTHELEKFMSCLPPLERLAELCSQTSLTDNSNNELVMKKILIDVWSSYLYETEAPLYHNMIHKLLPLAVCFFENQTLNTTLVLNQECRRIKRTLGNDDFDVLLFDSAREFVSHYRKQYREYNNLCMLQSINDYIL